MFEFIIGVILGVILGIILAYVVIVLHLDFKVIDGKKYYYFKEEGTRDE